MRASGWMWVSLGLGVMMAVGSWLWRAPQTEAQRGAIAFLATASQAQVIREDTKVAFARTVEVARGWNADESRFVAPLPGAYHFDLGVRIVHSPPALSCAYTFSLVQLRDGSAVRSVELLVLEQSTVDVGDPATEEPIMRQTAWRLRDGASLTLPLRRGDSVEVHARPNHELCQGQARVAASSDEEIVSFLSGHRL